MILKINTKDDKEIAKNNQLFKKFPDYPNDQTRNWLEQIKQNPRKAEAWETYMKNDQEEYKVFE